MKEAAKEERAVTETALIKTYLGKSPKLGEGVFVAETAVLLGDITIGDSSSILYGAVLRSDTKPIVIGARTNLQDNVVVHVGWKYGVTVGDGVTVGHGAILHGCTIEDGCLIGMRATLLNGCVIGEGSLIGAGTLVTEGTVIPPGSVVLGAPGRVVRSVTEEDRSYLKDAAKEYVEFGRNMMK